MNETLVKSVGTQKCIVNIDTVRDMAFECMEKTYTYRGRQFNLSNLGWRFKFSSKKCALGTCYISKREIALSEWFIENGEREMKMWKNTMVHEIAHAINHILGGRGHDWQWRDIFVTLGGNGERTSGDTKFRNIVKNPVSKYTLICPNGHASISHKVKRRKVACGKCCNKLNGGEYTDKFLLKQIKNW